MKINSRHSISAEKANASIAGGIQIPLWRVVLFIALVLMAGSKSLSFAEQGSAPNESRQNLESSEDIEKKAEADSENGKSLLDGNFFGIRARVDGGLELNYEYLDVEDVGDEDSDSSSDFFVSTAELVLRLFFNDYSKAKIVGAAEDFGKQGEDGKMRLDEAILTLKSAQPVFYLVVGKRVMPFGVFEDRLIEGTLNEDLYEIDEWGATVGVAPDYYGLDISFSIYRDTQIIDNLKDFDTLDVRPGRQKDDRFRSFIANLSLEPVEDALNLSFFYNSEPGDGRRNQSLGAAASIHFWNFTLDAEYITALEREAGENQEENKESAVVAGLAWNAADALLKTFQRAGLTPYMMDIKPLALARMVNEPTAIIVDVQPTEYDIVIIGDGVPQPIRTIPIPQEERLSWHGKLPMITDDLARTIEFYDSKNAESPLVPSVPIYVSGELADEPEICQSLSDRLGRSVMRLSLPVSYPLGSYPSRYTVNLGLAIKALSSRSNSASLVAGMDVLPSAYQPKSFSFTRVLALTGAVIAVALIVSQITMVRINASGINTLNGNLETITRLIEQKQLPGLFIDTSFL